MTLTMFHSFFVIALMIYSVRTGVRLWRVRPRAVSNTKRFLLVSWIYFVLARAAMLTVGLPPELNEGILRQSIVHTAILGLIIIALWLYLDRSEQVRRLYGEELPRPRSGV